MKYIILCGGIGKRNNNYSLPKPLNYVNGRHMIEYTIQNIPSDEIFIVYNIFLDKFNFREIIINQFKNKIFHFETIEYLTRGAVETAFVGINKFNNSLFSDDNVVFIDNDNVHKYPQFGHFETNFICYGLNYDRTNFSFIKIDNENDMVTDIAEKVKISDNYCCGIYGFKNIESFNFYAKKMIEQNFKTKNEFYFSQLYKLMLDSKEIIKSVLIEYTNHVGTIDEIKENFADCDKKKLRICYDLDNTLVTYPTIPNDYSTVNPIQEQIDILNRLKEDGHEIIIHTARRMKTHNHSVGKVIKDIAKVTIDTLEKFNIRYDELIFGKPIADIYIDDRAINPYMNNISFFGLFGQTIDFIPNKVANNKYNQIIKNNNMITKIGPEKYMRGELYFYQNKPKTINEYFSNLHNFEIINETNGKTNKETNKETNIETNQMSQIKLTIDYINGIPLFYLYKNKLITNKIIDDLFNVLQQIHSINGEINITNDNIYNNYFKKLESRFNLIDYPFDDAQIVYNKIINDLNKSYDPKIVPTIHGDFWFSNIILEHSDTYKLIDMKGQVDNILTLNGDMYYDYGKLYQSILGYDLILNDCQIDQQYLNQIKKYFVNKCIENNLNIEYLHNVTCGLIFGTIIFIEDFKAKQRVWEFIKNI